MYIYKNIISIESGKRIAIQAQTILKNAGAIRLFLADSQTDCLEIF